MKSPTCVKEVQQLNGRLAALSRFLAGAAIRSLPFYANLRKGRQFEWTTECEQAFQDFKEFLGRPPILSRPREGEPFILYLAVGSRAVASAQVKEDENGQQPVYFISKALQGSELNYQKIEKFAYTLILTSRRLCPYFQAHTIKVRTNQPIKGILQKPDLAGRILQWAVELSEFDLQYEARTAIKSQYLADFIAEFTDTLETPHKMESLRGRFLK